jgi:hypothetical protein
MDPGPTKSPVGGGKPLLGPFSGLSGGHRCILPDQQQEGRGDVRTDSGAMQRNVAVDVDAR